MAIPEGWSVLSIAELVRQSDGTLIDGDWIESKDQSPAGTVRLLQVGNVLRGRLRTAGTARWVTSETVKQLGCTLIALGDILIARMPDPVGRACLIEFLPTPSITAVDCAILRISEQFAHRQYLVQAFNSDAHLAAVQRLLTGTTRQRISRSNLASLPVPLPPLPEQKKIAAILLSVDETIAKTESVIAQLQIVKKAMMEQLLTKGMPGRHTRFKQTEIGEIPEEWEVRRIGSLGRHGEQVVRSGPFGSSLKSKDFLPEGIPVLTIQSLGDGRIETDGLFFVSEQKAAELREYRVTPNDLVFSRVADIGRCAAIAQQHNHWLISSNLTRVRLDPDCALAGLITKMLTLSPIVVRQIAMLTGSSGRPVISSEVLQNIFIALPPLEEQRTIIEYGQSIEDLIQRERAVFNLLNSTKSALSSSLLSGEIRVASGVA